MKLQGCGDNACMFGSPGGMGTNGGCNCLEALGANPVDRALRRRIRAAVWQLTQRVREVEWKPWSSPPTDTDREVLVKRPSKAYASGFYTDMVELTRGRWVSVADTGVRPVEPEARWMYVPKMGGE